jgi:hypothetical protein
MGVYLYAKGAGVVRAATEAYPAEGDIIELGKIAWNVGGEYCAARRTNSTRVASGSAPKRSFFRPTALFGKSVSLWRERRV